MGRVDLIDPPRDEDHTVRTSALRLRALLQDALETAESGRMLDTEQLERIRSAVRATPSSLLDIQRGARAFGYVCVPEAEYRVLTRMKEGIDGS